MRRARVLLADNDCDFLATRAEYLGNAGYQVLRAPTLAEAQRLMGETHMHLAVLDIRMVDDDDDKDVSGLTLAKDPAFGSIAKIMATDYPSYQYVQEALGPALDGLAPAVGFLSKKEGPQAMIEAVQRAFAAHVRINWDLRIHWEESQPLSFAGLVGLLEPDLAPECLPDRLDEAEDLFRKLFYARDQITFSRLLWRQGRRVALEVLAYMQDKEEQFVVTCGPTQAGSLQRETRAQVPSQLATVTGRAAALAANTLHFMATASTRDGTGTEGMRSFAAVYRERPEKQIRSALEHLWRDTLASWYEQGRQVDESKSLSQFYRERLALTAEAFTPPELERRMEALAKEAFRRSMADIQLSAAQVTIRFGTGPTIVCPHPVLCLYDDEAFPAPRVVCAATPGALDVDTILVDQAGRMLLTDLAQVGPAPIWHDFVTLETAIRFKLLEPGNLQVAYSFEEQLLATRRLSDSISTGEVEPVHRKALSAIQAIRHLASEIAGDHLGPYYTGLFFCTMSGFAAYDPALRHTGLEVCRLLHRLLLSAMLCAKIAEMKTKVSAEDVPPEASGGLWADEANREVWVEGRQATLTRTECDLLLYLYRRAGNLCTRSDILREVFGFEGAGQGTDDSLINTNINRLREKIERDKANPRYLITVRGVGYKLLLTPK